MAHAANVLQISTTHALVVDLDGSLIDALARRRFFRRGLQTRRTEALAIDEEQITRAGTLVAKEAAVGLAKYVRVRVRVRWGAGSESGSGSGSGAEGED